MCRNVCWEMYNGGIMILAVFFAHGLSYAGKSQEGIFHRVIEKELCYLIV
jgi:hypothetical protein